MFRSKTTFRIVYQTPTVFQWVSSRWHYRIDSSLIRPMITQTNYRSSHSLDQSKIVYYTSANLTSSATKITQYHTPPFMITFTSATLIDLSLYQTMSSGTQYGQARLNGHGPLQLLKDHFSCQCQPVIRACHCPTIGNFRLRIYSSPYLSIESHVEFVTFAIFKWHIFHILILQTAS